MAPKSSVLLTLLLLTSVSCHPTEDVSLAWNGLREWMPLKVLQGQNVPTTAAAIKSAPSEAPDSDSRFEYLGEPTNHEHDRDQAEYSNFRAHRKLSAQHDMQIVFAASRQAEEEEITVATVDVSRMKHPIIQLDQLADIMTIRCFYPHVYLDFHHLDTLDDAFQIWSENLERFIIVTQSPSCGRSHDHTAFLLIESADVRSEGTKVSAVYRSLSFHEAVDPTADVKVSFGKLTQESWKSGQRFNKRSEETDDGSPIQIPTVDDFPRGKQSGAQAKAAGPVASTTSSSVNSTLSFDTRIDSPFSQVNTLWGAGYDLHSTFSPKDESLVFGIYCIGCGVTGTLVTTASFTFTAAGGVASGSIQINGDLAATLNIATASVDGGDSWGFYEEIGLFAAAQLLIPGIVTVSPTVSLELVGSVAATTLGEALAGATFTWPSVAATLDIVNPSLSIVAGFDSPQIQPSFNLQEDIIIGGLANLIFNLTYQVMLFDGLFANTVALVQMPALDFNITQEQQLLSPDGTVTSSTASPLATASVSAGAVATSAPEASCPDETLSLFSAGSVGVSWLNLTYYTLDTWTGPYWSTCITGAVGRKEKA